jgi:hypothetical protein
MLSKIAELETRISTFDQTVAILDSASAGSGVFKSVLKEFSDFGARRQGIWLSKLSKEDDRIANHLKVTHYPDIHLQILLTQFRMQHLIVCLMNH